MKLELKHLAPYLPYLLTIRVYRANESLFVEDLVLNGEILDYLFENSHQRNNSMNIYKPILRPLSDITKEIEVNGERFIPAAKLKSMVYEFDNIKISFVIVDGIGGRYIAWQANNDRTNRPVPYQFYEKLYEWHFDIFGLIDAGLAVDINTVKF